MTQSGSRPKILYILHDIQIGGVEVALVSAVPELLKHFELNVLVIGKIDHGMLANLTAEEVACFHSVDGLLLFLPLHIPGLISFTKKFKPDIIVTSLWKASFIGTVLVKSGIRARFISFVHSTRFFHFFDRMFSSLAIKSADFIFVDSVGTRDFVVNRFHPKTKVQTISFHTHAAPSVKLNLPLNREEIRFMYLGRIDPIKNINRAIDAIDYLRRNGLNVKFDIYGPHSPYLPALIEYVAEKNLSDYISYRGPISPESRSGIFREYNFFVQLSSSEGMAMSVAEAMQHGLVCFVTPVGEIMHYAADMKTAVFADLSSEREWELSLKKMEDVIFNPYVYENISNASYLNFKDKELYRHSLTRNFRKILI